jgi:hypothetical protein
MLESPMRILLPIRRAVFNEDKNLLQRSYGLSLIL